jgi:xylan 1,4-beta-xylosidase
VEWRDGWLRLSAGGTKPQESALLPKGISPQLWPVPSTRDDFDSDKLDVHWSSLRQPVTDSWLSLVERPGWLRLRGRDSLFSLFAQSLIARRVQHKQFTIETCLEFAPTHFTQMAGLICYYDTQQHFYLRVTHDEFLGKVIGVVLTDDGSYEELADSQFAINDWRRIYLRARVDRGELQFSASPDATAWQNIGPVLDFSKLSDDYGGTLRFTGAMVGLCAQDLGGTWASADFDYFDYRNTSS